jgi:hypothetical protein
VVSYHTQISRPVHGATTHENSTTMSLYGYGLAYYAVEASLGVPTGCAGNLRWQTAGMFSEAAMAEPWDGVGKAVMVGSHKAQDMASRWVRCSHRW